MVQIEINGISVDFPFQPYKCQIDYMEKVITCLQEQKNGVLESPTGTGKTLCLLCAALAWRETFVAHRQMTQGIMKTDNAIFHKELEDTLACAAGSGAGIKQFVPKIIYASRTHSQLSQAVNELKNTIYRPKVCVLGSRDQMCINPEVVKLDGSAAKIYACKGKLKSRSCQFYNNVESQAENKEFSENVLDIEDLGKLADKHNVCPYFMSRELRNNADLIFMPYNYVLDFKSRQANSIDLNGTVILLDEAHNVEQICEETASFDLTSFDLACCIEDCDECIHILQDNNTGIEEDESPVDAGITPEDAAHLKKIFKNIENIIENTKLTDGKFQEEGSYLYNVLNEEKINASTVMQILDAIEKCNQLLANNTSKVHKGKHFAMQKLADVLKILFCRTGEPTNVNLETSRFYKVFIHTEEMTSYQKSKLDVWSTEKRKTSGRTLSFWCFHPGLSMKELVKHGVRSLILTSGTLSPLDSFTSELDISFPIQLQNPHVISNKQIWAGIITKGPDGAELNSSFQTRFSEKYLNSLGNLLANLSKTTPHGILVFFPSYPVMDKSIEFWKNNGALKRMEQNKAHFCEPRNKKLLNGVMEQFYEKVKDPELKGAMFFAVCRGKVSEGLDFANENGRVVVVTGLPFPPKMDPKVELKMQYLDNPKRKSTLTGRRWYRQQASRAVNQAVGRVIRHNQDYGAIWLCDVRFSYLEAKEQLPIWIKPHIKTYHEFGIAQRNVIQFFRIAEKFVSPFARKSKDQCFESGIEANALYDSGSSFQSDTRSKQFSGVKIHRKPPVRHRAPALSNFNSEASNSLAILKGAEQPVVKQSIFLSLSSLNQKRENVAAPVSTASMSATILNGKDGNGTAEESRGKARKIKMVVRKSEHNDSPSQCASSVKSESNSMVSRTDTAKQYISTVKKSLSPADYKKFGKILTTYKKLHDINYLIENLTSLFTSNIENQHLFEGFGNFVKEKDKAVFDKAYSLFKASLQAKSHEKTSSIVAPDAKRRKFDLSEETDGKNKAANQTEEFFPVLSDEESDSEKNAVNELLYPKCSLCEKTAKAPHKALCGHIACYPCWLKRLKKEKSCAKCGKEIRHRGLKKMFFY